MCALLIPYVVFFLVHPLVDSTRTERTKTRQETPAAEAVAWLEDPQPPAPPESIHERIARAIAEAIGWPVAHVQGAINELTEHDPEKRKCLVSRQIK